MVKNKKEKRSDGSATDKGIRVSSDGPTPEVSSTAESMSSPSGSLQNVEEILREVRESVKSTDLTLENLEDLCNESQRPNDVVVRLVGWISRPRQRQIFRQALRSKLAPFCVFTGMQSVGKSTTINHIMKRNVMFTDPDTGTRCPIQIRLQPDEQAKALCRVNFPYDNRDWEGKLEDLHRQVQAHMEQVKLKDEGVSFEELQVTIPSDGRDFFDEESSNLALILYDTPGVTVGHKQPGYNEVSAEVCRRMIHEYGQFDSTWIFLVEEFSHLGKLDNRNVCNIVKNAKHVALVVTHLNALNKSWISNTLLPASEAEGFEFSTSGLVTYIKTKLRLQGVKIQHVFFANVPESRIDETIDFQNWNSEKELKQKFEDIKETLEEKSPSFKISSELKGVSSLRTFISKQMLEGGKHLIQCVDEALEASRSLTNAKLKIHREMLFSSTSSRSLVETAIELGASILECLIRGNPRSYKGNNMGHRELVQPIEIILGIPWVPKQTLTIHGKNFEFKTLSGSFHIRALEMTYSLTSFLFGLQPRKIGKKEIQSKQSVTQSGQLSNFELLTKVLHEFLIKQLFKPLDTYLTRWFKELVQHLVVQVMKCLTRLPKLANILENDELAAAFRCFFTRECHESLNLNRNMDFSREFIERTVHDPLATRKSLSLTAKIFHNSKSLAELASSPEIVTGVLQDNSAISKAINNFIEGEVSESNVESFNSETLAISEYVLHQLSTHLVAFTHEGIKRVCTMPARGSELFKSFERGGITPRLTKCMNELDDVVESWYPRPGSAEQVETLKSILRKNTLVDPIEAQFRMKDTKEMLEQEIKQSCKYKKSLETAIVATKSKLQMFQTEGS